MASRAEVRSNDSVHLNKALGVPGGFEASHSPLALTRRLVRVLRPVVQVSMLSMSHTGHHYALRCPVAAQLVRNDDARFAPSCPPQLAKEPQGGEPVPLWLYKDVEDYAVLIYRSPEVVSDTVDLQEDFVRHCHIGVVHWDAMLDECRTARIVAIGSRKKSSQNAFGTIFVSA
ncbi:MAG: hypothetical protein JWP08_1136 [Bryobacterales bacterium]|nr:hypothetical protein [Bryobacterales bacterium]